MAKRTTKAEFSELCRQFRCAQAELGLTGYDVEFKTAELAGAAAEIDRDSDSMIAEVTFAKTPPVPWTPWEIRDTAIHEAVHLLLTRLVDLALDRHAREDDILQAEELIVRTLTPRLKFDTLPEVCKDAARLG